MKREEAKLILADGSSVDFVPGNSEEEMFLSIGVTAEDGSEAWLDLTQDTADLVLHMLSKFVGPQESSTPGPKVPGLKPGGYIERNGAGDFVVSFDQTSQRQAAFDAEANRLRGELNVRSALRHMQERGRFA